MLQVHKEGIGAIGVSKGGDMVLMMGLHIPAVTACVVINTCISSVDSDIELKDGKVFPGLKFDLANILVSSLVTAIDNINDLSLIRLRSCHVLPIYVENH